MKEAIILIGIPGTGKTSYAQKHYKEYHRYATDITIAEKAKKYDITHQEAHDKFIWEAINEQNRLLEAAMEMKSNVVIDQLNTKKSSRDFYIRKMKENGYSVKGIYLKAVSLNDIAIRLEKRDEISAIPYNKLKDIFNGVEEPSKSEGYDDLKVFATYDMQDTGYKLVEMND